MLIRIRKIRTTCRPNGRDVGDHQPRIRIVGCVNTVLHALERGLSDTELPGTHRVHYFSVIAKAIDRPPIMERVLVPSHDQLAFTFFHTMQDENYWDAGTG